MNFEELCELPNIDLHTHTKYSYDSFTSPKQIALYANKKKKYIAITDHNEIKGAYEARKYDKNGYIIIGEEVMTDCGEILAYNIKERINPGEIKDVIDAVHRQNGIVVLAHPTRRGILFLKKKQYSEDVLKKVDGIETLSYRSTERENIRALEMAEKYNKKIRTRGSDGHMLWELKLCKSDIIFNLIKNLLTVLIKLVKKIVWI